MRIEKALLVFRKDWMEVKRNWQILLPMLFIPLLFSIVLPTLLIILPGGSEPSSTNEMNSLIRALPPHIQRKFIGMSEREIVFYITVAYFFAPFFLIIPVMVSSVIASDSFAGEKERKTIEALLATPLSDSELFLGKVLVSFIPSMAVTISSFIIYSTLINIYSIIALSGRLLLPNLTWLMLILGVAPALAFTSIGLTVLISTRVKGTREAQQISALLIIPIMILLFLQSFGVLVFEPTLVAILILVFGAVAFIIFKSGVRLFKREDILLKMV